MQKPTLAAIKGIATWLPETKLTNADLEKMVDTNDQWIKERTGIEERRILKGKNLGSSYLGIQAFNALKEKVDLDPMEVDVLICTTVVPDYKFPPTACLIAEECGIKNAFCYDMNATCTGFLYALDIANSYVLSGKYKKVVIVSAEKLSSMTNYKDRASCILFGDGASAVLVEASDNGFGIKDTLMRSETSGAMDILFKGGGSVHPATVENVEKNWHYFTQDGRAVFKQAVLGMEGVAREIMERNNVTKDDLKFVMPHQANKRIIDTVAKRLGVEDKVVTIIQKIGNLSSVTVPLCITEKEDELQKGDKLVLCAFGSGYTMGAVYMDWAI
ncbi:MAG: beta-ketoacyl-ACP synthase III [Chitinophagales bacterium]